MADTEMLTVFCYDVADNRRRRRVARILEDRCVRVQKSVFEARLTAAASDRLAERVSRHLAPGDSLRVYAIGAHGRNRCKSWGACPIAEDQDFYLL